MTNPIWRIIGVRTLEASLLALALHWGFGWPLTGPRALGLFLTPTLCAYFVWVFVAPWSWGLPILTRLPGRPRAVALTFDDGPSPEVTPSVLEVLRRHDAHATFFVLGEAVQRHPGLLREIVSDGHAVGVHSFGHRPFVLLRAAQIESEIRRTLAAIAVACPDAEVRWLRPPHGFKSLRALFVARRLGLRVAAWNLDGRDYRGSDPAQIARTVLDGLRPGAIVLLHDGCGGGGGAEALPAILDGLRARGYGCAPLPSLAAKQGEA